MKNDYGNTPLHSAIENNNNTTINLLLEDLLTQQKPDLLKMKIIMEIHLFTRLLRIITTQPLICF